MVTEVCGTSGGLQQPLQLTDAQTDNEVPYHTHNRRPSLFSTPEVGE